MTDLEDYKKTELWVYQHLIGKFIYLASETKPNITFIIGQISKYSANPRKSHLWVLKRVVRYLKKTMQMGFIFDRANATRRLPQDLPLYGLVGYVNNNFTRDLEDRKSVMGYYFFLNGVIVLWNSKK